ncbi:MAG: hypothetical protein WC905_02505 [Patescibacteria group bacterium]|jgi:hypothetical protein
MITITLEKESPTTYKFHFEDKTSSNEGSNIELYQVVSKSKIIYIKTYAIIDSYAPCDVTVLFDTSKYNPKQHEIRVSGNLMSINGMSVRNVKISRLINDYEKSQIHVRDIPPSFHEYISVFDKD